MNYRTAMLEVAIYVIMAIGFLNIFDLATTGWHKVIAIVGFLACMIIASVVFDFIHKYNLKHKNNEN